MKGISPMIATVLLIAFTVAVGGIVSLFLTGLTKTQTGLTESTSTNVTKCAGVSIDIIRVGAITATNASITLYANPSNQIITSITLMTNDGSVTTGDASLTPGEVTSTNLYRGTNTSVIAFGLCQNSVGVKGSCKSGENCWAAS